MERKPKNWSGQPTPLMTLGTHVYNGTFPKEVPDDLLRAAADYCATRIYDLKRRKNNHRNRSSVKYYEWWLTVIRRQLDAREPPLAKCPGCGSTWSCGGGCPIWGYGGSGWR